MQIRPICEDTESRIWFFPLGARPHPFPVFRYGVLRYGANIIRSTGNFLNFVVVYLVCGYTARILEL